MPKDVNEKQWNILTSLYNSVAQDFYVSYDGMENITDMPRKELKPLVLDLRNKGYLVFQNGLMDDDGKVAGSGYGLTQKARDAAFPCDTCGLEAMFDYDGKKECKDHYERAKI